jgi:PIN domain nuclease of toxin-antitoxin system
VRLLLDTHSFIWWLAGDPLLSSAAQRAIGDERNEVFLSAASAWEIATKYRLGKLPRAAALASDIAGAVANQGFSELPITIRHAQVAGDLRATHKDPFDRMLIAQATLENLRLVSNETVFDDFSIHRLW